MQFVHKVKHGVYHSIVDLQAAINRFIAEHNEAEAKPFVWRANPDTIIASRNRGFQALEVARRSQAAPIGLPAGTWLKADSSP